MFINNLTIEGRLCTDPELKRVGSNNTESCKITIAYTIPSGNNEKKSGFLSCQLWKKTAEVFVSNFKKGDAVCMLGRISFNQWQDKDGNKRNDVFMIVDECYAKVWAKSQSSNFEKTVQEQIPHGVMNTISDDDIPF